MSLGDTECTLISTYGLYTGGISEKMTETVIILSPLKYHNGAGAKDMACEWINEFIFRVPWNRTTVFSQDWWI